MDFNIPKLIGNAYNDYVKTPLMGAMDKIIPSGSYVYDYRAPDVQAAKPLTDQKPINYDPKKDPNSMKLTVGMSPNFVNEQKGGMGVPSEPAATPAPYIPNQPNVGKWKSRYDNVWNSVLQSKGIDPIVKELIARSENGAERESYANFNTEGGTAGTFDIGLGQVNVDPGPELRKHLIEKRKSLNPEQMNQYINQLIDAGKMPEEASRLRKPDYAISKIADLYGSRVNNLGDPVLAIGSYNLGSGGAVLDPVGALNRAKYVYNHAGYELPDTAFTRDPEGFVKANLDKYLKMGLVRR